MEMESGRVPVPALGKAKKQALEKAGGPQSKLANKLLGLWAHGMLSAAMIRELADLAIQDGAEHPDLLSLAQTGSWGTHKGNCHKEVMRAFCPNHVLLPEGSQVKVNCIDPKTSLEKDELASIYLPHLMFSHLGNNYPNFFKEEFGLGKGQLETFWTGVQKVEDDRLENHPMSLEKDWKERCIPLFLHGDGVEFHSRDSLLVYSWGSMMGQSGGSLKRHWLLGCYPKSCTCKSTWAPMWKWLKWSFEALGKGFHPVTDPDGQPLEKGSPFFAQAGKPLLGGYFAHLWSVMGDHEFYSNILKLPHWASHYPCWECNAENWAGCDASLHYKEISLEKQKFVVGTHAEHLADPWSSHPIFTLPHVSSKNVRSDAMHILFSKGLYSHVIGSMLHYSVYHEGPGKVPKKKPWERLGILFSEIQEQYRHQNLEHRLTNLKLSMFTDAAKPWASKAFLDSKAGEAKHLLPALVPCLEKLFEGTTELCEQKMLTAASSLEKLVQLWCDAGTFLTPREFAKAMTLGTEFLDAYKWLNAWSLEKGRNSFAIVAKHHTFIHMLWNSKFMNPTKHWCFLGEDYVGHISKLAHSVSFGVSSTRLTLKICPKYRVLVHFLLTRNMNQDDLEDL